MRILAMYVGECGTEWCRLGDGYVAGGVRLDSNAVWTLLQEELDCGPGSEEEPIIAVIGGNVSADVRGDLSGWEVAKLGVEVELPHGHEVAISNRAADRTIGKYADALRQQGLLDADGPVRRAAAMALDAAARRGYA